MKKIKMKKIKMKKIKHLIIAMLAVAVSVGFTACGDDDEAMVKDNMALYQESQQERRQGVVDSRFRVDVAESV